MHALCRVRLVQPRGVRAVYAYGMALLVSRDAEALAHRLGRCGLFFFDERGGAGRRRSKFCSDKHRNQHAQWRFQHAGKRGERWEIPALP